MSEPTLMSARSPISKICYISAEGNPHSLIVGSNGITEILETQECSEYCHIPWLEVWAGDSLTARFNQHKVEHIFYGGSSMNQSMPKTEAKIEEQDGEQELDGSEVVHRAEEQVRTQPDVSMPEDAPVGSEAISGEIGTANPLGTPTERPLNGESVAYAGKRSDSSLIAALTKEVMLHGVTKFELAEALRENKLLKAKSDSLSPSEPTRSGFDNPVSDEALLQMAHELCHCPSEARSSWSCESCRAIGELIFFRQTAKGSPSEEGTGKL